MFKSDPRFGQSRRIGDIFRPAGPHLMAHCDVRHCVDARLHVLDRFIARILGSQRFRGTVRFVVNVQLKRFIQTIDQILWLVRHEPVLRQISQIQLVLARQIQMPQRRHIVVRILLAAVLRPTAKRLSVDREWDCFSNQLLLRLQNRQTNTI